MKRAYSYLVIVASVASTAHADLMDWTTGPNFQQVTHAGDYSVFPNLVSPSDTFASQLTFQYGLWAFSPVEIEVFVNNTSVGLVTADLGWITPGPSSASFDVTGLLDDGLNTILFTGHDVSITTYVIGVAGISYDSVPTSTGGGVIPAPGAAILAMIGLPMVGWVKRRSCETP